MVKISSKVESVWQNFKICPILPYKDIKSDQKTRSKFFSGKIGQKLSIVSDEIHNC